VSLHRSGRASEACVGAGAQVRVGSFDDAGGPPLGMGTWRCCGGSGQQEVLRWAREHGCPREEDNGVTIPLAAGTWRSHTGRRRTTAYGQSTNANPFPGVGGATTLILWHGCGNYSLTRAATTHILGQML
jgi:hypothetical protein